MRNSGAKFPKTVITSVAAAYTAEAEPGAIQDYCTQPTAFRVPPLSKDEFTRGFQPPLTPLQPIWCESQRNVRSKLGAKASAILCERYF